jgi:N4-gp56 family major capsid protein
MAATEYGDIGQRTAAWAATEMLSHAEPILVLSKFAQNKPLKKNTADTVKFRRPIPFALATTPLTEGVTPVAKQMQYEDVTVQLNQHGDVVEITDKVADLAEDPVLSDATMLMGEQAGETIEYITWGVLRAGTNVFYDVPAHTTRAEVDSKLTNGRLRAAVRLLKAQRAKAVTQMLDGSPKYATTPIEGGYIAFAHTDMENDIRDLTDFTPVAKYGSRKALCPEEIGSVENIRFILSPVLDSFPDSGAAIGATGMYSTSGTDIDVYPLIIIGKEAYGVVPLKGASAITPSVINPGKPSKSDPLGQLGYTGWKTYFAATRLNEAWMTRIEVGVTDLG